MLNVPLLILAEHISRFFRLPFMQRFGKNHPGLYMFLLNRFSLKHFFGLPFTLVFLIGCLNLMLLSELAEEVVNSEKLKAQDAAISTALFKVRHPVLSQALFLFTQVGSYYGLWVVATIASIFLIVKKKIFYLIGLLVSVIGSGIAVNLTKAYFVRNRPLDIGYYSESSFSFPSGHATGAVALEGFIFYLLIMESKDPVRQVYWLVFGHLYFILMGFSRIYLGVHFLTDVVAGWLLGFLWLLLGIVIMEFTALKFARTRPN